MSLPRGIRYETLPERLVQGKAFSTHGWFSSDTCTCECSRIESATSVTADLSRAVAVCVT